MEEDREDRIQLRYERGGQKPSTPPYGTGLTHRFTRHPTSLSMLHKTSRVDQNNTKRATSFLRTCARVVEGLHGIARTFPVPRLPYQAPLPASFAEEPGHPHSSQSGEGRVGGQPSLSRDGDVSLPRC